MTSSTNKQEFGLYDHGQFAVVIFSSQGTPGVLPDYFDEKSDNTLVLARQQDDLGWFEIDLHKHKSKFDICLDLLNAGFSFSTELTERMALTYTRMKPRS